MGENDEIKPEETEKRSTLFHSQEMTGLDGRITSPAPFPSSDWLTVPTFTDRSS